MARGLCGGAGHAEDFCEPQPPRYRAIWVAPISNARSLLQDNGRLEKTVLEPSPQLQPLSELLELPDFTTLGVPYRAP